MGVWSYQLINHHQIMYFLLLLLGLATSSPVPQHPRVTRQNQNLLRAQREGTSLPQSRQDQIENIEVPAGEAVDIFYRYGFFSLSVRVVPRDDHGSWIIREPTTKVFTPNSLRQVKQPMANKFDSQFQIYFCDDLAELMRHYFHDFSAEDYGSHYIRSLTIGDAVYQILALKRENYLRAKNDVLVEKKVSDFNQIYEQYLAPWIVAENGRVQCASGDSDVAEFLD